MTNFEPPFDLTAEWVQSEIEELDRLAEILPQISQAVERRKAELAEDPLTYFYEEARRIRQDNPSLNQRKVPKQK